jgi:hypothetical protein
MIRNRVMFSVGLMLGLISVASIFGELPPWWPLGSENDPERSDLVFGFVGVPSAVAMLVRSIAPHQK